MAHPHVSPPRLAFPLHASQDSRHATSASRGVLGMKRLAVPAVRDIDAFVARDGVR